MSDEITLEEAKKKKLELEGRMESALTTLEQSAGTLQKLGGLPKTLEGQEKKIAELSSALAELKTMKPDGEALKKLEARLDSLAEKKSERKLRFGDGAEEKLSFRADMDRESFKEVFSLARLFAHSAKLIPFGGIEKLALGEATGAAGGFLVPEEWVREVRDRITAQSVIRRAGATIYPMATDTLNVPRVSGGATAYWMGENTPITASDPTFANLQLVAKLLATLVKVSNQLLKDANNPRTEDVIRRDVAKTMALAEDLAFIQGTGAGSQPTGILNTSGIGEVTLGANGGTPTFDTVYDALYEVEKGNGIVSAWILHPRTKNTLRKIKDSNGQYIYNIAPSIKEPDSLVGIPVLRTTQIPINLTVGSSTDCSYILTGQFDEAIIGEREGLEFAQDVSGEAFTAYQTWMRAIQRLDFGLRTPSVFCKVTGVRP